MQAEPPAAGGLKAEFDLQIECAGEMFHRPQAAAGFLQHAVERGVCAVFAAQAWGQHV